VYLSSNLCVSSVLVALRFLLSRGNDGSTFDQALKRKACLDEAVKAK